MIWCKRTELKDYLGLSAEMDCAIKAIESCDLQNLQPGKNELCNGIYGNAFVYETKPEENRLYETHIQNTDIHLIRSGEEGIAIADVNHLEEVERKLEKDYIGSQGAREAFVRLTPQYVLIVFPGEAHKTGCRIGDVMRVEKFVVKVPVK